MGRIRTLMLAVVVGMLTVTVPSGVTFAQTKPNQIVGDISSNLLAMIKIDLGDDLEETKSCLEREGLSWNESLDVERFDLNRTRHGWLVQGLGKCLAGNANGPTFLYIRDGDIWRKLLYEIGQSLEICAPHTGRPCPLPKGFERKSSSAQGWPDLALWRHSSAWESDQLVYRFDGKVYKVIACNVVDYGNPTSGQRYSQPRYSRCGWDWWKASE
jgi:hypothetical protein